MVGLAAAAGCSAQDRECLARAGRKARAHFEGMAADTRGKVPSGWQAALTNWDEMTLDARVSARLRWEKALAETPIQVQINGNEVQLSGKVHDLAQRQRAVELARSTAGVDRVIDQLEVAAPTK